MWHFVKTVAVKYPWKGSALIASFAVLNAETGLNHSGAD